MRSAMGSQTRVLLLEGESCKSGNNHTNHAKSNSIISNGDAKTANGGGGSGAGGGGAGGGGAGSEATNGIDRPCDKAAITELNDEEDEGEAGLYSQYSIHSY